MYGKSSQNKSNDPLATLFVKFYDENNLEVGRRSMVCNTAVKGWQFLMMKIMAPADYSKVVYYFDYSYNTGTANIATPFLYKETYGQSYTYDSNGNLISSTDAAEKLATFAYQDDALCSSFNPTGSQYIYTRDESTNNILNAFANSGQKIDLTYNDSGDGTSMTISDAPLITDYDGSTTLGYCYIINAKTGRAIGAYDINEDSFVNVGNFHRTSKQQWSMYILSSGIVTIRNTGSPSYALYTYDAGTVVYHRLKTIDDSSVTAAYKFKFVSNGDGTYRILTGQSGYENCLTMTEAKYENGYYKLFSDPYEEDNLASHWYIVSATTSNRITTSATYSAD